jgi:hypothetical protein
MYANPTFRSRPFRQRPSTRRSLTCSGQKHRFDVAPSTGPLARLSSCDSILVVADVENLAYGGRDLGLQIDFAALASLLRAATKRPSLHAFFSADEGDVVIAERLTACGWTPHSRAIIQHTTQIGRTRSANADLAIAFGAAKLLGHQRTAGVLLGTGDGVLALDCARAIRTNFKKCTFVGTMSLAGSTSRLIDAQLAREIDVNIEIGMDAMGPLGTQGAIP